MTAKEAISVLAEYGIARGLIPEEERDYTVNLLLDVMKLDAPEPCEKAADFQTPDEILKVLMDDAYERGILEDNGVASRDLFDTKLMSCLTPRPSQVTEHFCSLESESVRKATDWFYDFSKACGYIRQTRIEKNVCWKKASPYGEIDITINLSKPEKDPKAIAAAKTMVQSGYPKCLLCPENVGYAGTLNHPARQNLRIIPLDLCGEAWGLQYSPYSYYNEHCIVLNTKHVPMQITDMTFRRLLAFVERFPHYFLGSNADLPIVGGSILTHDHFQGGRYTFAMERAEEEIQVSVRGFEDVSVGIVHWPLSVLRLRSEEKESLLNLASLILAAWRRYSDPAAGIEAFSDGVPHNTITPIARMRDGAYELDLVLRCNVTSEDHPLGVFHPHTEKHHIKKENIGLIEVMGLAVLPARLKSEMAELKSCLLDGRDPAEVPELVKHADWAKEILTRRTFTAETADEILNEEIGQVFIGCLEDAGVYKCTAAGREAFLRFVNSISERK